MDTPFFPFWRAQLAPMGARLARTFKTVRAYTRLRTFWSMLWQAFNPKASCREVALEIQALFELHGGPNVSEKDGA